MKGKNILLIVTGSIAAQKSPALVKLLVKEGANVRCIATRAAQEFVSLDDLEQASGNPVSHDLWKSGQTEEGAVIEHIDLTRKSDLVLITAASANFMARMVHGYAEDLAEATLLANNAKPVLIAPAMNVEMWNHPATRANVQTLIDRGAHFIGPADGSLACGETGLGRMSEPEDIAAAVLNHMRLHAILNGYKALVTSGPTYEPLDPVRFLGNRSSGKQGHAIAKALSDAGADVTLVTGPVSLPDPAGVKTIHITTAQEMLTAAQSCAPFDIAVCAAAVSDWRAKETSAQKIKKSGNTPTLELTENPDILATISNADNRPALVVGFAAETANLITNAKTKIDKKGCDMILANDVSADKVFGQDETHIHLVTKTNAKDWGVLSKTAVAKKLVNRIIQTLQPDTVKDAAE